MFLKMRSLIESLGTEGVLPSEFDAWSRIREAQNAVEWIDPDPSVSMQFSMANDTQKANARRRVAEAIQAACDTYGLVQDYPVVEEGQAVTPAPDGTRYFQDWSAGIAAAVVNVRKCTPATQG